MNFKIYFINDNASNQDAWFRFKNSISIACPEYSDNVEHFPHLIGVDYPSLCAESGFQIKPAGGASQIILSQYPDEIGRYLTHYKIYETIISENLDAAIITEANTCASDLILFLKMQPNYDDNSEIINISKNNWDETNCYIITNRGAKKAIEAFSNMNFAHNNKRLTPSDFGASKEMDEYDFFVKSDPLDLSKPNTITTTLGGTLLLCTENQYLISETFGFSHSTDLKLPHQINHTSFPDFKEMDEETLNEFVASTEFTYSREKVLPQENNIDFIYYINLDQDFEKAYKMKLQLSDIGVPNERFPAVKPDLESIQPQGKYYSFFKRNKFLEARAYFEEQSDWINLEKYQLGTLGCYLSHYTLLNKINKEQSDLDHIVIVEDDVKLNDSNIPQIEKCISSAPEDWDIIRSTWSSPNHLSPIQYCHPLSSFYEPEMAKRFLARMKSIKYDCFSCCPVMNTFYGGTHFQIIKVSSIPKIIEYLDSDVLLPIDGLYTTHMVNVYHQKLGIDFGLFGESGIQQKK